MKNRFVLFILFIVIGKIVFSQKNNSDSSTLIFSDDFSSLDKNAWITEIAPLPDSKCYIRDGKLVLDTKGGITVWLNKKLSGNIRIEYTRTVLIDTGRNDRLSDLNSFWMAADPRNQNFFTRNGILESYDSLKLYYVGMGGNTNSTTRFRKYQGNGERTMLGEFTDKPHLLEANKEYHVVIIVKDGLTSYSVNGETFFSYHDPSPLKEGYFGFRSTKSRQAIDSIKVFQLY